jgi:hypothetical protein
MIPAVPKGLDPERPCKRRQVLFNLGSWEIVLYADYSKAYVVHTCRGMIPDGNGGLRSSPPRAITGSDVLNEARTAAIQCWSCKTEVPQDLITIAQLYNA